MKTNNIPKILTGLVLAIFLASCVPESLHPLSDPDKAFIDSRLTGTWTGKSEDESFFVHFLPRPEGKMDVLLVSNIIDKEDIGEWSVITMFSSKIDDQTYMNMKFVAQSDKPCPDEPGNFFLCRYRISDDSRLAVWAMTESAIITAIENGLKGETNKGKWVNDVKITAETNELSEYIKKHDPELLFGDPIGDFYRLP